MFYEELVADNVEISHKHGRSVHSNVTLLKVDNARHMFRDDILRNKPIFYFTYVATAVIGDRYYQVEASLASEDPFYEPTKEDLRLAQWEHTYEFLGIWGEIVAVWNAYQRSIGYKREHD